MGAGLIMAGAAVLAGGAVAGGLAERETLQARQDELEARKSLERAAGEARLVERGRQLRRIQGRSIARRAASGVQFSGTPLDATIDDAGQAQLELERIKFNSLIEQNRLQFLADEAGFAGRVAATGGFIEAGAALLSSFALAGAAGAAGAGAGAGGSGSTLGISPFPA